MAMLESPAEMPAVIDTYGLPDYRVTTIAVEACGADIRILAGDERFGQTSWSHICTIPATALLKVFPMFEKAAILAMTIAGAAEGMTLPH